MIAIVTGASGWLGRHLSRSLKEKGWRVIGLSRSDPGDGPWDYYISADIAENSFVGKVKKELKDEAVTIIFHLAALVHDFQEKSHNRELYERINRNGTCNLLELATHLGVKRFVYASSTKVYGDTQDKLIFENSDCKPETVYGCSKLNAEVLVKEYSSKMETVILRFSMIYGRSDHGNLGRMGRAIYERRFPSLPDFENLRSLLYIEDAVHSCILASIHPEAKGEVFNVTDGVPVSTYQLYISLRRSLGIAPPKYIIPVWVLRTAAICGDGIGSLIGRKMPLNSSSLEKLSSSAQYSSKKISEMLGYNPEWPLERGLSEMATEIRTDHQ